MRPIKLTLARHGRTFSRHFDTIKEAACYGQENVETNEAAPILIEKNGAVIWKNTGPFDDSYDRLYELAGAD